MIVSKDELSPLAGKRSTFPPCKTRKFLPESPGAGKSCIGLGVSKDSKTLSTLIRIGSADSLARIEILDDKKSEIRNFGNKSDIGFIIN